MEPVAEALEFEFDFGLGGVGVFQLDLLGEGAAVGGNEIGVSIGHQRDGEAETRVLLLSRGEFLNAKTVVQFHNGSTPRDGGSRRMITYPFG